MSIKDLLKEPFKTVGVRLSDLGQTHRHAPTFVDLGAAPLTRRIGDFISSVRDSISGPSALAADKAENALEAYIDQASAPGFKESVKVELTKQWLTFNHTSADLVAVSASKESGIDPTIVGFVLSEARGMGEQSYTHVVGELSGRVLDFEHATDDPMSALAFVQAAHTVRSDLPNLKWIASDLVDLHVQGSHWGTHKPGQERNAHQQLFDAVQSRLVELAHSPRSSVLLVVARCPDPAVQTAVLSTAATLGRIDPGLRTKIEAECALHAHPAKNDQLQHGSALER